ncbi:serine O-acetyltransferase [Alteromonas confluentis]|uniref:Serine acetyltransferase n=1 Tax=Alteromonas confluentis TaxID=1656094 RepID=A0A1E7ZC55_9ALTE|nr:serine acetyltransferase [Alteromonas confluentis]OFC71052.1 serine acetyltransferase [Alteromonas confluentis]
MFELIKGDLKFKQDWFLSQKSWFVKNVRIFLDPGTIASTVYRYGSWTRTIKVSFIRALFRIPYFFLKAIVVTGFGIYIPSKAKIGKGFTIHNFSGIFISEGEMGENVIVFQGVTIGHLRGQPEPPKIGNNVLIAAGAKVLGSVTIGNNVVIGANSVVINDVPDNCTVMGNPARIISRETNWMSEKLAGNDNNY